MSEGSVNNGCQIDLHPYCLTVSPSPTLGIKMIADGMRKQGIKVYDFGVGEMNPEIPLPPVFQEEIVSAITRKETHYCPASGDSELRHAIAEDLQTNFKLNYNFDQVIIFPGPKDAIFRALLAVMNPFSERVRVIAFAPVYESFTAVPYLLTGKDTIIIPTDQSFLPDFDALERELHKSNEKIAAIIINSPNNPTGTVYSSEVFKRLASIIGRYPKIAIISDEVYRTIRYDAKDVRTTYDSIANYLPNQSIVVGGISKEVSGTGLRIGFTASPKKIADVLEQLVSHFSACVNLAIQRGYERFLRSDKDMKQRLHIRDLIQTKRDLLLSHVKTLPGLKELKFSDPQGAFYFFPNIENYLGKTTSDGKVLRTDEDLAVYILKEGRVVTIPGSKFGKAGYLRMAFACMKDDSIKEGLEAFSKALEALRNKPIQ